MRLISMLAGTWFRFWRAVRFWRFLHYTWRLSWAKAGRV